MDIVWEIREALLEGKAVELIPADDGGYIARIGMLDHEITGKTAAECFRTLAAILERR